MVRNMKFSAMEKVSGSKRTYQQSIRGDFAELCSRFKSINAEAKACQLKRQTISEQVFTNNDDNNSISQ